MANEQATPGQVTRPRSTLPILFSVVIIDLIGFGIVMPILPFYAEAFGASASMLGAVLAIHAAMQFVFSPIWGRISDRIGRRPIMLITMAGTSFALLLLGLADGIALLFAARALSGLFAANISVATAYVSDVTAESERTRWMGMIGACFGIGFVLGPAIGGLLAPFGHSVPMYVAAGLAAANCLYAVFALREPAQHARVASVRPRLSETLRNPALRRLGGTTLLFTLGVAQLESVFAYLMMDRFGYDARQVAFILVLMAVVMATIQGGGMRALAARFGERSLLIGGFALMSLAFPLVPNALSVGLLLAPLIVSAIGRAIAQPSLTSLVSMQADPAHRGAVMGAYQSAAALARIFGPLTAGILYDISSAYPFYLASALCLASAALCLGLRIGLREPEPASG